jgi:hypothetical protein
MLSRTILRMRTRMDLTTRRGMGRSVFGAADGATAITGTVATTGTVASTGTAVGMVAATAVDTVEDTAADTGEAARTTAVTSVLRIIPQRDFAHAGYQR